MNIFSRALISIKRNAKTYILLFVIITIISTVIAGSISMLHAANNTESNLRKSMLNIVSFTHFNNSIDFDDHLKDHELIINRLSKHESVQFFEHKTTISGMLTSSTISRIPSSEQVERVYLATGSTDIFINSQNLRGFSNPIIFDIEFGEIDIIAGRTFTADEIYNTNHAVDTTVAIISREFAHHNNLWVGDFFNLEVANPTTFEIAEFESISFNFEVIGIRDFNDPFIFDFDTTFQTSFFNDIYVPNWIINNIKHVFAQYLPDLLWSANFSIGEISADFILYRTDDIPGFIKYIEEILTPLTPPHQEGLLITDYSNRFSAINSAIAANSDLIIHVTIATIVTGLIIISLIIMLVIINRKNEVSVYISLGMKKRYIIAQVTLEIVFVATLSIITAFFIGNFISELISDSMLLTYLNNYSENALNYVMDFTYEKRFGFHPLSLDDMIVAFDTSINLSIFITYFIVTYLIIAIATAIPMFRLFLMKPIEIIK